MKNAFTLPNTIAILSLLLVIAESSAHYQRHILLAAKPIDRYIKNLSATTTATTTATAAVVSNVVSSTDIYWIDYRNFGTYGGVCKCSDGTEYTVGALSNDCMSLACYGGGVGSGCNPVESTNWANKGVFCDGKSATFPEGFTKWDYNIAASIPITINWTKDVVCPTSTLDEIGVDTSTCAPFIKCVSSNDDESNWSCVYWDSSSSSLETYLYQGCEVTKGIPSCEKLAESSCEVYNNYSSVAPSDSEFSYLCDIEGTQVLMNSCTYDSSLQIVKCCESLTGSDKNCRHFTLTGDVDAYSSVVDNSTTTTTSATTTIKLLAKKSLKL